MLAAATAAGLAINRVSSKMDPLYKVVADLGGNTVVSILLSYIGFAGPRPGDPGTDPFIPQPVLVLS